MLNFFTHTTLRKQAATLSQALEISELQQDQLATFLGHDIRIHREFYRLPQDILQKAKVAKILMNLNHGLTTTTDDISDQVIEGTELELDEEETSNSSEVNENSTELMENATANAKKRKLQGSDDDPLPKKKMIRKPWTDEEKRAIKQSFRSNLVTRKNPHKIEILSAQNEFPVLARRSWKNIKDFVRNTISSGKDI